jgi:hypothetical protein
MPTTITASNGNVYHLWQLPDLSSPEPEIGIAFTTLDNDLSDGYRSTRLYGSNTGVRKWKLTMPTLAALTVLPNTVTDINGASVSREEYIWSLFCENKVTGTPFAYQCPRNGQYYLVDFEEEELNYKRMIVKLYSTGLTLRQRRLQGVTVFSVGDTSPGTADWYDQTGHGASWADNLGSQTLTPTGDVVFSGNPQNSLNTVRLSGSASTGRLNASGWNLPAFEIFIVMKMREATFSNNAGILTDAGGAGVQYLVGTSGGTKFQNLLDANDKYYLNGTLYANSDMQAPMNTFGIVQMRNFSGGWDFDSQVQIGKDRATGGTFAKADIAEIISYDRLLPLNEARAVIEYLTVKWAIT